MLSWYGDGCDCPHGFTFFGNCRITFLELSSRHAMSWSRLTMGKTGSRWTPIPLFYPQLWQLHSWFLSRIQCCQIAVIAALCGLIAIPLFAATIFCYEGLKWRIFGFPLFFHDPRLATVQRWCKWKFIDGKFYLHLIFIIVLLMISNLNSLGFLPHHYSDLYMFYVVLWYLFCRL